MNKKFIAVASLVTLGTVGVSTTFANTNTQTPNNQNAPVQMPAHPNFSENALNNQNLPPMDNNQFPMGRGHMGGGKMMTNLTESEKTQLDSMSDEDKKKFFENKMNTEKTNREAQEAVIDKLLAGTTLTADEEKIRQEIITERANRKAEIASHEAEHETIKTLLEKQKAGTTLTTEEQNTLNNATKNQKNNFQKTEKTQKNTTK